MTQAHPYLLAIATALCLAACKPTPAGDTCPPEAAAEALHAATYRLERDPDGLTLQGINLALRAVGAQEPVRGPAWRFADRLLKALRKRDLGEADWRYEVEQVRMELQQWPCMPEALHQRFHARLDAAPPTPTR